MRTEFAAVDAGTLTGAVYAGGRTPEEAIAFARSDARDPSACYRIVPITTAASAWVGWSGGAPCRELAVRLSGVTLVAPER